MSTFRPERAVSSPAAPGTSSAVGYVGTFWRDDHFLRKASRDHVSFSHGTPVKSVTNHSSQTREKTWRRVGYA